MSRRRKLLWLIAVPLALFVLYALARLPDALFPAYHFETADRGFWGVDSPGKPMTFESVQRQFEQYRNWRGEPEMILYRTTKPDYTNPWLWYDIATHPRWDLPYMEPSPQDTEAYWKTVFDNKHAAFKHAIGEGPPAPFIGSVKPGTAADVKALIAERGSLTFLSWNGQWIGGDNDTDITFLPGGEAHMFRYGEAMIGYRGTYAIDAEGTVTLNLPTLEGDWPAMSLLIDESSFLLMPREDAARILRGEREPVGGGFGGFWPFRPIPAEDEAQARKDIAERGGT